MSNSMDVGINPMNPMVLSQYAPRQYSVWWVKFSFGNHPAVILSDDKYSDGANVIVASISRSSPRGNKCYEKLWIPVSLEPGKLSYIQMTSIYTVQKTSLFKLLGYVPFHQRELIRERFIAVVTGADVHTLMAFSDTQGSQVDDEPPASISKMDHSDSPIYSVNTLDSMLIDTTLDTSSVNEWLVKCRMRVTSIDNDKLPLVFIAMIREYGCDSIYQNKTLKRRFVGVINEMYTRNMIDADTAEFLQVELPKLYPSPTQS